MRKLIRWVFSLIDIHLIDSDLFRLLSNNHKIIQIAKIIESSNNLDLNQYILSNLLNSKSQLLQDLFAHYFNDCREQGFFVEIGAADGITNSNTYLLEHDYNYTGILVEPAKVHHKKLSGTRKSIIEVSAIWSESNKTVEFLECNEVELSTIRKYKKSDHHSKEREDGKVYEVPTITLIDLLAKYSAPRNISYLSMDTEGSELDILKDFDFSKYIFNFITIEHNFSTNRNELSEILSRNGYKKVFEEFSFWDDFFIHNSILVNKKLNNN